MVVPQAYTNLNIFKRIEVWILLALTVAGLVFVISTGKPRPEEPENLPEKTITETSSEPKTFAKDSLLEIHSIKVRRESDRFLAEVDFTYDNQSDKPITTANAASLIPESKKAAPVFFLAFTGAPPILPAGEKTNSSLQFSLQGEEIAGELNLRIAGNSTPIKSSRSFDPESIKVGESKTFTRLDW